MEIPTPLNPAQGSLAHAYQEFLAIRPELAHQFPTYSVWILSAHPECRAFRQGWTARGTSELMRTGEGSPLKISKAYGAGIAAGHRWFRNSIEGRGHLYPDFSPYPDDPELDSQWWNGFHDGSNDAEDAYEFDA